MTKRLIAVMLALLLVAGMLTACEEKNELLTIEEAQQIVLDEIGLTADDVTMHTHITTYNNAACYSIYVTVDLKSYEYIVDSSTGQILSVADSQHSH